MKISIKDPRDDSHWEYSATQTWARRHDNGALVSCGLTVGEGPRSGGRAYLSARTFDAMKKARTGLRQTSRDEWNHSGCQSSCVLRGAATCRW
jgi:hypothetical protein